MPHGSLPPAAARALPDAVRAARQPAAVHRDHPRSDRAAVSRVSKGRAAPYYRSRGPAWPAARSSLSATIRRRSTTLEAAGRRARQRARDPAGSRTSATSPRAARPRRSKPYLLYVGNRRKHKSLETLLLGLVAIPPHADDLHLTGPTGDERSRRWRLQGAEIALFGRSGRRGLIAAYRGARALVHPSLGEGFGLTMLEASALGTPVIASLESLPGVLRGRRSPSARATCSTLRGSSRARRAAIPGRCANAASGAAGGAGYTWDRCAAARRSTSIAKPPLGVIDVAVDARRTRACRLGCEPASTPSFAMRLKVRPTFASRSVGSGEHFTPAEQIGLPLEFARLRPRLAYYSTPLAPFVRAVPYAIQVHDLTHVRFPDVILAGGAARSMPRRGVDHPRRAADRRRRRRHRPRLGRFFGVPARTACASCPWATIRRCCAFGGIERRERPYILYAGNRRPHKNLATLVEAWRRLPAGAALDLVVAGPGAGCRWRRGTRDGAGSRCWAKSIATGCGRSIAARRLRPSRHRRRFRAADAGGAGLLARPSSGRRARSPR